MQTKTLIFGLLILLVQACSQGVKEESFYDFYEKFESDSLFQMERVRFPVQEHIWGDELDEKTTFQINREEWSFLDLRYNEEIAHREMDAYTQALVVYTDSAKVCLRGVDNGIYVDFDFLRYDGLWYLVSSNDFSN